jgi:hypothetical protein
VLGNIAGLEGVEGLDFLLFNGSGNGFVFGYTQQRLLGTRGNQTG